VKIFKKQTITVNPVFIPFDTVYKTTTIEPTVLVNGDRYTALWDTLLLLGDFSLHVGDSADTPLKNATNFTFWGNNACSWNNLSKKGVVTQTSTETIDGITFRTYNLEYKTPDGQTHIASYSERFILNTGISGHIFYNTDSICNYSALVEASSQFHNICYFDSATSAPNKCIQDLNWLQHLSIDESKISNFKVYPNPAESYITFEFNSINFDNNKLTIQIMDINGKSLLIENLNNTIKSVDIQNLSPGTYFYKISNNEQNLLHSGSFIKK